MHGYMGMWDTDGYKGTHKVPSGANDTLRKERAPHVLRVRAPYTGASITRSICESDRGRSATESRQTISFGRLTKVL